MKLFQKLSPRSFSITALFVLALLAGTGPLALGQESVQGTMTLPVAARLGSTLLPPGEYKFSVQLIGSTRSVAGIQLVATPVSVLVIGMSKDAPIASALAMASRPDPRNPKLLELMPDGSGLAIHSISLDTLGLVLQFFDSGARTALHVRAPQSSPSVISAKASD
jgi:hypothetical protein